MVNNQRKLLRSIIMKMSLKMDESSFNDFLHELTEDELLVLNHVNGEFKTFKETKNFVNECRAEVVNNNMFA